MDDQPTLRLLADAELDAVTGGHHGGQAGNGGTTEIVQLVEVSIGEVVAAGTGNTATVTLNIIGSGTATTATQSWSRNLFRH
nr:hypothetical protein [uncultured Rhodopila sp.]